MALSIPRQEVFEIWCANKKKTKSIAIFEHILQKLDNSTLPKHILDNIKICSRCFSQKIEHRYNKANRYKPKFISNNSEWLQGNFKLSSVVCQALSALKNGHHKSKSGRPQKKFEDCGPRAQKNKLQSLLASTSQAEILRAAEIKLRKAGKKDSASVVKTLAESPETGTKMKRACLSNEQRPEQLNPDQGLALLVDARLSTYQYNLIRNQVKHINRNLYPAYYRVREAKQQCYPSSINVTEELAEIKLQSLIDHTVKRLCQAQIEVLRNFCTPEKNHLQLIIKWGCDGADQQRYKQKYSQEGCSDESLFSISMVPLQLCDKSFKSILWQNPSPSSTRYCRPIKFIFAKETVEMTNCEIRKVEEQISSLFPTKAFVDNLEITITCKLILCMIDGKVCNALSSCASTQTCYLCGAKPRDMNNPTILAEKPIKKCFCLSVFLLFMHGFGFSNVYFTFRTDYK